MLSNILIVLIVIGGVILAWLLMSAIFYFVVFLKGIIQSFRNLDVNQQVQDTPNVSTQLQSKDSDNQWEVDSILKIINEREFEGLLENNLKKNNSQDLQKIYILERNVSRVQHINTRNAYIEAFKEVFKHENISANKIRPDAQSPCIKFPISHSNSRELMPYFVQN